MRPNRRQLITCIAGLAEHGRVWIAGDNAGFMGGTILQHMNGKVFRTGEFAVGCAGRRRLAEVLRYSFKPPPIRCSDIERYMVTAFTDELRTALSKAGYLQNTNGVESADKDAGDAMLIGIRGMLFFVDCYFAAASVSDGIFAVGCGMDLALGALHVTPHLPPEQRLTRALEAAEKYSDGVVGPFHVISVGESKVPELTPMKIRVKREPLRKPPKAHRRNV